MKSSNGATKMERKTVEKNRRMHMKNLCFKLSSLIPKDNNISKEPFGSRRWIVEEDVKEEDSITSKKLKRRNCSSSSSTTTRLYSKQIRWFLPDALTQQDHLDQAAAYIKTLKERIEGLKQKKKLGMSIEGINKDISGGMTIGFRLPVIEVRCQDSNLEVVIISGLNKKFMFHEIIGALEEEGAEVVNASFSIVDDKIFHTIHSQAICSRIGVETSRLSERLRELIH